MESGLVFHANVETPNCELPVTICCGCFLPDTSLTLEDYLQMGKANLTMCSAV